MNPSPRRRALVSVSDKEGLLPFAKRLTEIGFEIVSTGGTRRLLQAEGLPVLDIAEYTGFPEIMDGRVKTLHPKVHGALLCRPDREDDTAAAAEHGIVPFELVVCNLYPFQETIAGGEVEMAEAVEQIDIGGPSMIRAAAKNHAHVAVVTHRSQYEPVLAALEAGTLDEPMRRGLAAEAFETTARYDRAIADYMRSTAASGEESDGEQSIELPGELRLELAKKNDLRYGENPHQRAAFYVERGAGPTTIAGARQLHGKELSFNNLLDLDAALSIAREFDRPAAAVIKHTNPCGCGVADSLAEAFDRAYSGDPVSAFGSVLGFNRRLDAPTAEKLCEPGRFIEAIVSPGYEPAALEALRTRPKWKKNVRLIECAPPEGRTGGFDLRRIGGGLLAQERDDAPDPPGERTCVTRRKPTDEELADLDFGWRVCKHVKSNAIVFARGGAVVGVGAGQMSRLDSTFLAARKAGERSEGSVLASDAFFPFRDGIDEAAQAGVRAVIQPGGSRRDEEVIAACEEHGIAMVFTGRRHFRH